MIHIKIDNEITTFTNKGEQGNRIQYNTKGNKEAHSFSRRLEDLPKGAKFYTNGHQYEIL